MRVSVRSRGCFSAPAVLGECSSTSQTSPVLFALAGLLALSIKGKVLSARAPIGPGEQDPAGSLSSRADWPQQASVTGGGSARALHLQSEARAVT